MDLLVFNVEVFSLFNDKGKAVIPAIIAHISRALLRQVARCPVAYNVAPMRPICVP